MKKKVLRRIGKTVLWTLAGLLFLLLFMGGMVHTSPVQGIIARKVAVSLGQFAECEVHLAKLDINLFKRAVTARGVEVFDSRNNRTVFVSEALATLKSYNFRSPSLSSLTLYNPQVEIRRYQGDTISDFKRVLKKIAAMPKKDTALRKAFIIEKARLYNGKFLYDAQDAAYASEGKIDFKHVGLEAVNLNVENFYSRCGVVRVKVNHVRCKEKTGFNLKGLSADIYVRRGEVHFYGARFQTQGSKANLRLSLVASTWKCYRDFVRNVNMEGEIYASDLWLQDLGYFAPVFQSMPQQVSLAGKVNGPVTDLDLRNLQLAYGKTTRLNADARLTGLPKIKGSLISLHLKQLKTEKSDWESFVLPHDRRLALPGMFSALDQVNISGTLIGGRQQFVADMNIATNLGSVRIDRTYVDTLGSGRVFWAGRATLADIRLDKILHNDTLFGKADVETDFRLAGSDLKEMSYVFGGEVGKLEIAGDDVGPVFFELDVRPKYLQGYVSCDYPELDFTLDGTLDRTQALAQTHCELDLRRINLQPLHLLGDTGRFTLKTHIVADYAGYGKGIEVGDIVMESLHVRRLGKDYSLPRLNVKVNREDTLHRALRIRSSLLDADVTGRWNLVSLRASLAQTLSASMPNLGKRIQEPDPNPVRSLSVQDFDLHLRLKDTDPLMAVLYPSLSLPLGLDVNMEYVSERENGWVEVKIPYVQFGKLAYMAGKVDAYVDRENFDLCTMAERLYLDDSIAMNDFSVHFKKTDSNTLDYTVGWGRDSLALQKTNAVLGGRLDFLQTGDIRIGMQDYNLLLGNNEWKSYPDGYLLLAKDSIVMNRVGIYATGTSGGIIINGELSRREGAVLKTDFSDFDLAYLEYFLHKTHMKIDARLNGGLEMQDFFGNFLFKAGLRLDKLTVNGHLYGAGLFTAAFSKNEAVQASFEVRDSSRKRPFLSLTGGFYPKQQKKLDFKGYADNLSVAFLSRILASVADNLEGTVSGDLRIGGVLTKPELYASVTARDFAATIPILQTRYRFSNLGLELTSDKVEFKQSIFYDPVFETNGKITGRILHRNFKDMRLDLGLSFEKLLVLQSKRSPRLPFWGTIFASGSLGITGPVDDISMLLNATVEDNSDISFDFSNPSGGTGVNFITFKVPSVQVKDSGSISLEQYYFHNRAAMRRKGRLTMDLNMNVTPGLAVSVLLRNTAMNGDLKATGKGLLRLHMAEGNPQLFGTYTISDGEFDFSMVNVINKRFALKEGGTISWVGPMTDARINVQAGYQTKASLYPILAAFDPGNESRYKQKVNVESQILLSGRLLNPDIGFNIDLSNTDEDTKDKFRAIVKKDDEDEILRQTFSLLMFNSFMTVEGSSTNVANTALSSSSEILFSQFNNFLSKLTNDFNIGINYKPGTTESNSEFQVMMSGQLFNDRLVINGNLGVSENNPGNTASATTVVGDVDIEWKFTEELRLRGFNHSNDEDLTKPVNSYTQGVGIVFRRDFDNAKEFLYGTRPRRTKEERRAERQKNREIRRTKHSRE